MNAYGNDVVQWSGLSSWRPRAMALPALPIRPDSILTPLALLFPCEDPGNDLANTKAATLDMLFAAGGEPAIIS